MPLQEREARYSVDIRVDCTTRDFFVANRLTNISRGGLFVEVSFPFGAEIELVFRIPGAPRAIHARGRVAWNYDTRKATSRFVVGSGIRFTQIAPEDRALLEAQLERLATEARSDRPEERSPAAILGPGGRTGAPGEELSKAKRLAG